MALCIEPSEIYSSDLPGEGVMNKTVTKYSHNTYIVILKYLGTHIHEYMHT